MVACIDNDGNPVRLGAGQPTKQGHTPGPWHYCPGGGHAYNSIRGSAYVQTNGWPERINGKSNASYSDMICENLGDVSLPGPDANAALIAAAPWHALLLRAVLKGWALQFGTIGYVLTNGRANVSWPSSEVCPESLPACPDAETYERIRKAIEG